MGENIKYTPEEEAENIVFEAEQKKEDESEALRDAKKIISNKIKVEELSEFFRRSQKDKKNKNFFDKQKDIPSKIIKKDKQINLN